MIPRATVLVALVALGCHATVGATCVRPTDELASRIGEDGVAELYYAAAAWSDAVIVDLDDPSCPYEIGVGDTPGALAVGGGHVEHGWINVRTAGHVTFNDRTLDVLRTSSDCDDVGIRIAEVATHELGHFLGLDHDTSGSAMRPRMADDCSVKLPSADELDAVRSLWSTGVESAIGGAK